MTICPARVLTCQMSEEMPPRSAWAAGVSPAPSSPAGRKNRAKGRGRALAGAGGVAGGALHGAAGGAAAAGGGGGGAGGGGGGWGGGGGGGGGSCWLYAGGGMLAGEPGFDLGFGRAVLPGPVDRRVADSGGFGQGPGRVGQMRARDGAQVGAACGQDAVGVVGFADRADGDGGDAGFLPDAVGKRC